MKILMVSPYPEKEGAPVGGVAGAAYRLVCGLKLVDPLLEICVVTQSSEKTDTTVKIDGVTVYRVSTKKLPGFLSGLTLFKKAIRRICDDLRPDLVHYQGGASWLTCLPVKSVLTLHGILEIDILFNPGLFKRISSCFAGSIEKYYRKKYTNVISINDYALNYINTKNANIRKIPNPVDACFFNVVKKEEKNIIFCGSVRKIKNIIGALDIFSRIDDEYILNIVGPIIDESYYSVCLSHIKNLGLEDRVVFSGYKPPKVVANMMSCSRALLLTSYQENSPLVISEAMAVGLPVVAYDVGGVANVVENDVTGFVVPWGDCLKASFFLNQLIMDNNCFANVSAHAKAKASASFTLEQVAYETLSFYRTLACDRTNGGL